MTRRLVLSRRVIFYLGSQDGMIFSDLLRNLLTLK